MKCFHSSIRVAGWVERVGASDYENNGVTQRNAEIDSDFRIKY